MGTTSEPTTDTENSVTNKKLRIKILVKKPANEACKVSEVPEVNCVKKELSTVGLSKANADEKVNCIKKVSSTYGGCKAGGDKEKVKSTLGSKHKSGACQSSKQVSKVSWLEKSSVNHNQVSTAICDGKLNRLNPIAGCKRRSEEVLENHERKRLKMDASATLTCCNILKKLMNHDRSAPFHTPVNPDLWGLDDYFDIIKNPMDLGTIQQKLQQNKYCGAEQFEADMRLTFSNAMLYNPPGNWYHQSAKELLAVFDRLWKPVKIKTDREHSDFKQKGSERSHGKVAVDVKNKDHRASTDGGQLPRKALLQKAKSAEDLRTLTVEGQHSNLKTVIDGDSKPNDSLSSKTHSDISVPTSQCARKGKIAPRSVKCEKAPRRKIEHDDFNSVKVKSILPSQRGNYHQDSDTKFHESASIPTTDSLGTSLQDAELSPSRALRVAKLMDRFSETILKAQLPLLEQVSGTNLAVWQKEKVLLQMRQREDKARIEAQIKAVKCAARQKTEFELKKQRQAEREAARVALQSMEQSVFVDDNLQVLKDLETMVGYPLVVMCQGDRPDRSCANTVWSQMKSDKLSSPLERLGLFIKEEYQIGNESDYIDSMDEDLEDGEVIC